MGEGQNISEHALLNTPIHELHGCVLRAIRDVTYRQAVVEMRKSRSDAIATGGAGFIVVPTVWRMITHSVYTSEAGEQLAFSGRLRLVASTHDEVIWSQASNAIHFSIADDDADGSSCALLQPSGDQVSKGHPPLSASSPRASLNPRSD